MKNSRFFDALLRIRGVDKHGHTYHVEDSGMVKVNLRLEPYFRKIGHIKIIDGELWYIKEEQEAQRHRKTNSWSVSDRILRNVDAVKYITELGEYSIKSEEAIANGSYLHFKETTEVKVYTPLQYWEKKMNSPSPSGVEVKAPPQGDLFQ